MDKPNELSKQFNASAQPSNPTPPAVESEQVKKQQQGLQGGPKPPGGASKSAEHNRDMSKDNAQSQKASEEYKAKLQKYNQAIKQKNQNSLTQEFNKKATR